MTRLHVKQHFSPLGWGTTYCADTDVVVPNAEAAVLLSVAPDRFEVIETEDEGGVAASGGRPGYRFRALPMTGRFGAVGK